MGKNPKTNPIVMTIGNYIILQQCRLYHTVSHQSPPSIASELGLMYFVKDYAEAARLYPEICHQNYFGT